MLIERSRFRLNGLPVIVPTMAQTLEGAVSPLRENVSTGGFPTPLDSYPKAAESQASWANHLKKPHGTAVFLGCCSTTSVLLLETAFLLV